MAAPSRSVYALQRVRRLVGEGEPGDRLPSEKDLAAELGVSRVTVRDALERLWHEGAIVRRWGAGTFIANDPAAERRARHNNFYIDSGSVGSLPARIAATGREVSLHDFHVDEGPIPDWVREEPGFDGALWRVVRCLWIDGSPAVLMVDHFAQTVAGAEVDPGPLADLHNDLLSFLGGYGSRVVKQEGRLVARPLDAEQASLLRLDEGTPVIVSEQRTIVERGDVVACSELFYRSDGLGQILVRTAD